MGHQGGTDIGQLERIARGRSQQPHMKAIGPGVRDTMWAFENV
jgi:hypothetical protein